MWPCGGGGEEMGERKFGDKGKYGHIGKFCDYYWVTFRKQVNLPSHHKLHIVIGLYEEKNGMRIQFVINISYLGKINDLYSILPSNPIEDSNKKLP